MCELADIPGLAELWGRTVGDERICVAVVDGPVDIGHQVFHGANIDRLENVWPEEGLESPNAAHGTHVASVVFGQHGSPVPGVAPRCRGLSVPAFSARRRRTSQLELARGIELAVEAGAQVINVSGGQLSASGEAEDALDRAVRYCQDRNVLVVAAVGNDGCFCNHVPAGLPWGLAVGAVDDDGQPLASSNWGPAYREHGILAPGENIVGAVPGGTTMRRSGSSLQPDRGRGGRPAAVPADPVRSGARPDGDPIGASRYCRSLRDR